MISLGLVGVGAWGRRYAETVGRRGDCRVGGYARSSAGGEDVAWVGGAKRFGDAAALLAACRDGELDGVIVATTPASQAAIAREAVSAGIPLLVEKPLGVSAADARSVCDAAEAARLDGRSPVVLVNFVHLWSSAYRALAERVRALQLLGETIVSIETEGSNHGPFRTFSSLLDYGPHDLALCLDLVGTQAPLSLHEARRVAGVEGGELFEARFSVGNVPVAFRVGNGATAKTRRFRVSFASGRSLTYDDTQPLAGKLRETVREALVETDVPLSLSEGTPLDALLTDFLAAIARRRERGEGTTNLPLALRVAETLDAIDARSNS